MNYNDYWLDCLSRHKNIVTNHSAMQDNWRSPLPDVVEKRKMPPHNALGINKMDLRNFDYKQIVEFIKENKETVQEILETLKEEA